MAGLCGAAGRTFPQSLTYLCLRSHPARRETWRRDVFLYRAYLAQVRRGPLTVTAGALGQEGQEQRVGGGRSHAAGVATGSR